MDHPAVGVFATMLTQDVITRCVSFNNLMIGGGGERSVIPGINMILKLAVAYEREGRITDYELRTIFMTVRTLITHDKSLPKIFEGVGS